MCIRDSLCDMPMSGAPIEGGDVKSKLLVDAAGERFINEAAPAIAQVTAMADRDAAPYYVLFDASSADVAAMLDEAADGESVVKADTVEALADVYKRQPLSSATISRRMDAIE